MKKIIFGVLAAMGMLVSASASAEVFGVATANAELVCKMNKDGRSKMHNPNGFTAYAGNFSINENGLVVESGTLKSILENNSAFVASAGGNIKAIPCAAAVAEIQRYVAMAYIQGLQGFGLEAILAALINLNTSNPGVTYVDDSTIVYTWTLVFPGSQPQNPQ